MNHSQRLVALCLAVASVMAIAHFTVQPVFSQTYTTVTSFQTYVSVVFTTSTSFLTYATTQSSRSSVLTYITTMFTTSTSFLTYVQPAFTSSTSTISYPAAALNSAPGSINPFPTDYFSSILYAFLIVWAGFRTKVFYPTALRLVRRILSA